MKLVEWIALVLALVLVFCHGSSASFTPVDNYLIACGSPRNVTFQGRTFVPDSGHSSLFVKSGNSVVASSNSSSVPSPLYQSARIFTGIASYKFEIKQEGRHWVRLYFYPPSSWSQNLTSASITVVTDDFVLLNNFTFKNYNGSYMFKEYAINVTSDDLTLSFIVSNNSVTFINAIEVVSMPDGVLPDQALAVNPSSPFSGLSELAFETVYRLNMGGPLLTAQNDTLGRTWENDAKYLHVNSSAVNVSVSPSSIKYPAAVTPETAPNWVYATAETMGEANVPSENFNITWVFTVDPNFMYFVRVHFCDIVSKALNSLVFNVYINSDNALGSLDLSSITGGLAVPYYKDFVSNSSAGSDTLTVSVGPDTVADITDAILNGLEVMKISNEVNSLDGFSSVKNLHPSSPSKNNKIVIIVGCVVGSVVAVALIGLFYCCLAARKAKDTNNNQGHPWLPLPLYVNIAEWAMTWQKKGMLDQIMDQNLVGKVNPASLKKFGETAEKCLAEHGVDRPSMGDVLWNLEYALQLEETSSALMEPEDNSTNHIPGIQLATIEPFDNSVSMIDAGNSCTDDDAEDAATSAVFSQLVNPRGR
ncbi:hypothetical protein FEM48_Zijuj01G0204500 [Ziziphus jujuba var. spinosa]|uniref:Malectin-like domain-containing protein n=1 Tax=Ziziphus jujuba var. spinosa TaxID=714518 RepID=A0A978W3D8_ZIZJJ|nr:hypothetical protein FEM48_Zijuj01G0204500 [Ziziphus jujuba var. spinosa]